MLIDSSHIDRCNVGVTGAAGSAINIRNSTVSFNTTAGIRLEAASTSINVDNSYVQGNLQHGVIATAGTVRLGRSSIVNNANGLNCAGGTIASYGDNLLEGNGTPSVGCPNPLTAVLKK